MKTETTITRLLILSLLIFAFSSTGTSQAVRTRVYNDEKAYEAYSTVLSGDLLLGSVRPKELVIRDLTVTHFGSFANDTPAISSCLFPDPENKESSQKIIDNYLALTRSRWRLRKKFNINTEYRFISNDETLAIDTEKEWAEFHLKFPQAKGIIGLSPVAFNSDETVAVFSIHQWCGLLCGQGAFYFLQKRNGRWIPFVWKGDHCGWIAQLISKGLLTIGPSTHPPTPPGPG